MGSPENSNIGDSLPRGAPERADTPGGAGSGLVSLADAAAALGVDRTTVLRWAGGDTSLVRGRRYVSREWLSARQSGRGDQTDTTAASSPGSLAGRLEGIEAALRRQIDYLTHEAHTASVAVTQLEGQLAARAVEVQALEARLAEREAEIRRLKGALAIVLDVGSSPA